MATDAELMHQELEALATGETADQSFVGVFSSDLSGSDFLFTLSSRPGREPALRLTTDDGDIEASAVEDPTDVWTVTITVHYEGTDTDGMADGDYAFDLWDTTNNARVAAGIQPLVIPARLDEVP